MGGPYYEKSWPGDVQVFSWKKGHLLHGHSVDVRGRNLGPLSAPKRGGEGVKSERPEGKADESEIFARGKGSR